MNLPRKLWEMTTVFNVPTTPNVEEVLTKADQIGPLGVLSVTMGMRGDREDPLPGLSNEGIARHCVRLQTERSFPLFIGEEIARAIPPKVPIEFRMTKVYRGGAKGKHLDTYFSVMEGALCSRKRGIKRVVVVAHPGHAWRVARCAEKCGLEVVAIITDNIPYDPESNQEWCRSEKEFRWWEMLKARPYYLLTGRI